MKNIQKSIRMTNEVNKYVEGFKGNGFNEKFENLVLFCMKEEKAISARLKEQQKTCEANEKRIELQRKILNDLENISRSVGFLVNISKSAEVSAKGVQLKMQAGEETEKSTKKKKIV